uniref:HMG-box superfamily protein n=1 Tax=Coptotermes formosanus TaxID=36987 RepID=R4V302_COPFO|nr:HMG-box superfamily protein [Coptotermes formosanus]
MGFDLPGRDLDCAWWWEEPDACFNLVDPPKLNNINCSRSPLTQNPDLASTLICLPQAGTSEGCSVQLREEETAVRSPRAVKGKSKGRIGRPMVKRHHQRKRTIKYHAYSLFCKNKLEQHKVEWANLRQTERIKAIGAMWKAVSADEKREWDERARRENEKWSQLRILEQEGANDTG